MIDEKTSIIGHFNGTIEDLVRPFMLVNSPHIDRARRLAVIYLKYDRKFTIRADIAFAQMIHETGYLTFTGTAKPDWNNFAGVGITGPTAVQKFATEELGVLAQFIHLCWYIYPKHVSTLCSLAYDPRHFSWSNLDHPKYNGDTTIARLRNAWAVPGTYYPQKLAYYANIINGAEIEPEKPFYDVIIQMGHVGITHGSTGTPGEREWNAKLGALMEPLMAKTGLKYRIMGGLDWLPDVPNQCKVFFSMHCDGAKDTSVKNQFTMGYRPNTDHKFKEMMAVSWKNFTGFKRRKDNGTSGLTYYYMYTSKKDHPRARYDIQRVEAKYYCLLEHDFYTNLEARKWLNDNINKIAQHHVNLIKKFFEENG